MLHPLDSAVLCHCKASCLGAKLTYGSCDSYSFVKVFFAHTFSVQTEERGEFMAIYYTPCSLLKLVFIFRLMVMLLAVASNIFQ